MRTRGATAVAALALLLSLGMWNSFVDRMIFHPTRGADLRPEDLGIEAESVWLVTEDGVRIHAYTVPSPGASRAVLFLHGNAGNASHRLPNAALLARLGAQVLLLDYRGYGLSDGTPSEAGVYADARAGLAYVTETLRIPVRRTVLFGRSLGGAVAVDLAQDRDLAGVILESTFTSTAETARELFGPVLGALAPKSFASLQKIGRVRAPLLFFHGDRDEIVAYALGRRLFDAAPEPKHFETISGAGHNNTVEVGGHDYFARIGRFLDEVAPR